MSVRPDVGLERLIHGLEKELLEAADEEFMAGARELGMNLASKGSAAFMGVKDLSPQLLAALRRAYQERLERTAGAADEQSSDENEEQGPGEPGPFGTSKRNADA
jgi:hypothetical protein